MKTLENRASASTIESWSIRETDFPATASLREQLRFLLHYAILAPSSHNTQPWHFALTDDGVDLFADRTRALAVVDPEDRELTISCGAALLNLRIALRRFGYQDVVQLFPHPEVDDLLARVRVLPRWQPTAEETMLFVSIPERRTNRQSFAAQPVPRVLLSALEGEADEEGAWLQLVEGEETRRALADLIAGAELLLWEDRRYRRELAAWIHPHRGRRGDGIPGYATGLADLGAFLRPFIEPTREQAPESRDRMRTIEAPVLAVLGTEGDSPSEWLAAGQALERVLLRAQTEGLGASFLNQPIEIPEMRPKLRDLLGNRGFPQLILRMGFGPDVPPTPRRPLHEVLIS